MDHAPDHAEADSLPGPRSRYGDGQAARTRRGAAAGRGRGAEVRGAARAAAPRTARHAAARDAGARSTFRRTCCSITAADGPSRPPPAAASGSRRSASTWCAIPKPRTPRRKSSRTSVCARRRPATRLAPALQDHAARGARTAPRGLARGGRRQGLPPSGNHQASTCAPASTGSNCTAKWITTARRPACRAAGGPAPRRHHGAPGRRHLRPAARGVAGALRAAGRAGRRRKKITCASGATRRACWMRCWRRSPKCTSMRCSSACANACAPSTGVKAAAQPAGFVGQLRDYQCEGLGWMEFLREFGFGGCLADDMGVGKTAQVLATLETRRTQGSGPVAGGRAEIADVQLARRGRALHAATARAGAHRPGARHRADSASTTWC